MNRVHFLLISYQLISHASDIKTVIEQLCYCECLVFTLYIYFLVSTKAVPSVSISAYVEIDHNGSRQWNLIDISSFNFQCTQIHVIWHLWFPVCSCLALEQTSLFTLTAGCDIQTSHFSHYCSVVTATLWDLWTMMGPRHAYILIYLHIHLITYLIT